MKTQQPTKEQILEHVNWIMFIMKEESERLSKLMEKNDK